MTDRRTIKALPSYWRGVVFRSRTEARWAAFFDAMGLLWLYEPEGFELDDGNWYLPDFWLPEMEMWVEIKPRAGFTDRERHKCRLLARGTGRNVLLLHGAPRHDVFVVMDARHPGPEWPDEWGACFSSRYTVDRRDGAPRLYSTWPDEASPTKDGRIEELCAMARRANVREPTEGDVLPLGWAGVELPF